MVDGIHKMSMNISVNPTIFSSINITVEKNGEKISEIFQKSFFTEIVSVKVGDDEYKSTDCILGLTALPLHTEIT